MKPKAATFVPNPLFLTRAFQTLSAQEELPVLPLAMSYEPWIDEPRGQRSYVMGRDEERQRFLAYNYWKYVSSQRKRRGDHKGAKQAHDRAMHLREYLTRLNMPLVYSMVARRRGQFHLLGWDEAISEGSICLLRALNGYDVKFMVKFSTYAVRAILRGLMNLSVKRQKVTTRLATVELPDVFSEDSDLPVTTSGNNEDIEVLRYVLDNNLAELNDVEKAVVGMRFGLGGSDDLTLEQIGKNVGVSKERIRQVANKALAKIRVAIENVV